MKLKAGVRVLGLRPEMVLALLVLDSVFKAWGSEFVVTSAVEGEHMRASLHYTGSAVDVRLPTNAVNEIIAEAARALGEDFDVILETNHIHIEFQPKRPY